MQTDPPPEAPNMDELIELLRQASAPAPGDTPRGPETILRARALAEVARDLLAEAWQAAPPYEQLEFWAPAFIALALDADAQRVLTAVIDSGALAPEELAG